jgi:MFS transporter, SP family, general alpha glucoside:H+ symporter
MLTMIDFVSQINSFYGLEQFQNRFGVDDPSNPGAKIITPAWQTGLSNSALVGQLAGLVVNMWAQDRFGNRATMMFFLTWMACAIFIPFFAPNLSVLAFGEAMCGVSWGQSNPYAIPRPILFIANSLCLKTGVFQASS